MMVFLWRSNPNKDWALIFHCFHRLPYWIDKPGAGIMSDRKAELERKRKRLEQIKQARKDKVRTNTCTIRLISVTKGKLSFHET